MCQSSSLATLLRLRLGEEVYQERSSTTKCVCALPSQWQRMKRHRRHEGLARPPWVWTPSPNRYSLCGVRNEKRGSRKVPCFGRAVSHPTQKLSFRRAACSRLQNCSSTLFYCRLLLPDHMVLILYSTYLDGACLLYTSDAADE